MLQDIPALPRPELWGYFFVFVRLALEDILSLALPCSMLQVSGSFEVAGIESGGIAIFCGYVYHLACGAGDGGLPRTPKLFKPLP